MFPIPQDEKLIETKVCKLCQASFPITDKDMEFYDKVSPVFAGKKYLIPTPTLCPDCRQQRRLAWRNERKLYKRKCDATGKEIISIYSPDKPLKIYHHDYWWGDSWDSMDYGMDYDSNKGFLEQFSELLQNVPHIHKIAFFENENSEFTNYIGSLDNCYLEFGSANVKIGMYGYENGNSENILDCLTVSGVGDSYECINLKKGHNCQYVYDSENISDSSYIINCQNLDHCFGCVNLRNRKYHIFNKPYSPNEYENELRRILLRIQDFKNEFLAFSLGFPRKNLDIIRSESSDGDFLEYCKNCHGCFQVWFYENENVKYSHKSAGISDSYDLLNSLSNVSLCLDSYNAIENVQNTLFSYHVQNSRHIAYSSHINNSSHLFGCIGLRNKQYCILNKQYSKEEYETLVPKIIEKMIADGEWGEFFPTNLSPFGYNETVANEYFPLTRDRVFSSSGYPQGAPRGTKDPGSTSNSSSLDSSLRSEGRTSESSTFLHGPIFNWSDYEAPFAKVEKIIPASKLPDDITKIPDDILNWAIECEVTGKLFRIIKQELEFYRKHNLPIPRRHPDQRHKDRMALRNPRKLFERKCDKCQKDILTTYAPERPEIVYCEECYSREVA